MGIHFSILLSFLVMSIFPGFYDSNLIMRKPDFKNYSGPGTNNLVNLDKRPPLGVKGLLVRIANKEYIV